MGRLRDLKWIFLIPQGRNSGRFDFVFRKRIFSAFQKKHVGRNRLGVGYPGDRSGFLSLQSGNRIRNWKRF